MSPPTQYRLSGRRFLQVKRPNQQHKNKHNKHTHSKNTENHLVYNNTMGWSGDGSHRGQGCQAEWQWDCHCGIPSLIWEQFQFW